jgi:Domain of unknown function (DUF6265)
MAWIRETVMKRAMMGMAAWTMLAGAAPAAEGVEALAWLSGVWVQEKGGRWAEERWAPARGGVMLGTSLSGSGPAASEFEFLRLATGPDGAVSYWGSPGGKPAVPFRLVSLAPGAAVFENPAHDYPTRISYRRSGDTLTATISGAGGANAVSWTFRRR